jgi:3',5'-cyclic AMP phosphodiesterase CpdA
MPQIARRDRLHFGALDGPAIEQIGVDPQRDARVFVTEHPRHRQQVGAGTNGQTSTRGRQSGREDFAECPKTVSKARVDRHRARRMTAV